MADEEATASLVQQKTNSISIDNPETLVIEDKHDKKYSSEMKIFRVHFEE
jgi:hypothetical protein